MALIPWDKLMAMEGDELTVHLLPYQCSLLIRLLHYLEDNPLWIDGYDEMIEQAVTDVIDDIEGRLSRGIE